MQRYNPFFWTMLLLALSPPFAHSLHAQLEISWYSVDSGGGDSSGGAFELSGTIGQPDAGVMSGGAFQLQGGFRLPTKTSTLLADVNLDGAVNLLDVDPFIERISSGEFQDEADCNQDGVVNLLDVDPFIELLAGG